MTVRALGQPEGQVGRLVSEPAELLVLQHCHEIKPSVINMMDAYAHDLRKYMIIDGSDTTRILKTQGLLYGAYLCDTLLCLAETTTFRPLWSADVLEELGRNMLKLGLAEEAVDHRIGEMRRSFPDAMVRGYEDLAQNMTCDPKDRHVLAAAVRGHAEVLVTFNIKDFPEARPDDGHVPIAELSMAYVHARPV